MTVILTNSYILPARIASYLHSEHAEPKTALTPSELSLAPDIQFNWNLDVKD